MMDFREWKMIITVFDPIEKKYKEQMNTALVSCLDFEAMGLVVRQTNTFIHLQQIVFYCVREEFQKSIWGVR